MFDDRLTLFLFLLGMFYESLCKHVYILSRDCKDSPTLKPGPRTKQLVITNLDTALFLYSHEAFAGNHTITNISTTYPLGLSCEVVVHSPVENAKIMMKVDRFYIPSDNACEESYLYVFDSNTATSNAMPEAHGERGLCRTTYPTTPLFTTSSSICIAFHTSNNRLPQLPGLKPGFRLLLTAISDSSTSSCASGLFFCGQRPLRPSSTYMDANQPPVAYTDPRSYYPAAYNHESRLAHYSGYCISEKLLCDGTPNCADDRDETKEQCEKKHSIMSDLSTPTLSSTSWLSILLSLGIPASIAIAVSTIVLFTICIGTIICCCPRCCKCSSSHRQRRRTYPHLGFQSQQPQPAPSQPNRPLSGLSPSWSNGLMIPGHAQPMCATDLSSGTKEWWPNNPLGVQQQSLLSHVNNPHQNSPSSYNSIHSAFAGHMQSFREAPTMYPGNLSNFTTDQSDSCCYTPPPYGACTVPPASCVTASSSRTGTISGLSMFPLSHNPHNSESGKFGNMKRNYATSGSSEAVLGPSVNPEGEMCITDSNGILYGGGNSVLHTNTPVENISQTGGDLISNGGIVYLGDVFHLSDSTEKFHPCSGPNSMTTGDSGSSHGRRPLYDQRGGQPYHRRSRPPSHRQYRHRQHRSADPVRNVLPIRSHAISHSDLHSSQKPMTVPLSCISMESTTANAHARSDQSVCFPVEL